MEYLVEARSEHKKKFVEAILPSIIQQLGLTRSRKTLLIRIANECGQGNEGMTMPLDGIDSYVVVVRPGTLAQIGVTLAHEMVHVRQLAKGLMKFLPNQARIWMGKRYNKRTHYLDQPWELDAFARQEILIRKAIEL